MLLAFLSVNQGTCHDIHLLLQSSTFAQDALTHFCPAEKKECGAGPGYLVKRLSCICNLQPGKLVPFYAYKAGQQVTTWTMLFT